MTSFCGIEWWGFQYVLLSEVCVQLGGDVSVSALQKSTATTRNVLFFLIVVLKVCVKALTMPVVILKGIKPKRNPTMLSSWMQYFERKNMKIPTTSIVIGLICSFLVIMEFYRFPRVYKVSLVGDSLINRACLDFDLIGKLKKLLPGYLVEFTNHGINGAEIATIQYYLPRALYNFFGTRPG